MNRQKILQDAVEQDMTVEEAASLLNVSQEFVVKLLDNGEIP